MDGTLTVEQITLQLKNGELMCQEKSEKSDVWTTFQKLLIQKISLLVLLYALDILVLRNTL